MKKKEQKHNHTSLELKRRAATVSTRTWNAAYTAPAPTKKARSDLPVPLKPAAPAGEAVRQGTSAARAALPPAPLPVDGPHSAGGPPGQNATPT
jgi:hypothetical protein